MLSTCTSSRCRTHRRKRRVSCIMPAGGCPPAWPPARSPPTSRETSSTAVSWRTRWPTSARACCIRRGRRFAEAIRALDFLLLHRFLDADARQCERVRGSLDEGIRSCGAKFEYVTRQLGYLLGCDLYDGYLQGRVTPGFVRSLLLTHVEEPGMARDTYFVLAQRLRTVPRRQRPAGVPRANRHRQASQAT